MLCNQFHITRSICQQLRKLEWCRTFAPQFQESTPENEKRLFRLNSIFAFFDCYSTYPAEKISISGRRLAVLVCSFDCSPSIIDAESSELPPMSKPLFELFASAENDLTNLKGNRKRWTKAYVQNERAPDFVNFKYSRAYRSGAM